MKILSLFLILITFGFHLAYAESESQIEQELSSSSSSSSLVTYDFGKIVIGDANIENIPYDTLYVYAGGEVSINENVFLKIEYRELSISETYIVSSESQFAVGVGYHYPLNDIADIVLGADIVYARRDLDWNGVLLFKDSDMGYGLNIGFRVVPIPDVELGISANFINVYSQDMTLINAYATQFIKGGNFGIGVVFEKTSTIDMIGIGFTFKSK